MSKTYNPVTGTFVEDEENSNVQYQPGTEPSPKTGVQEGDFPEAIGPEITDHPGWFHPGSTFMRYQFQLGAKIQQGGKTYVVKPDPANPGSVYHAHWEEQTD